MNIEYDKFVEWAKQYSDWPSLELKAKTAFTGWDIKEPNNPFDKTKEVIDLFNDIVILVETASKELAYLSNKDKLELVVKFIDEAIYLPFFLEWADQIVIRHMVTVVVEQYNRFYGHKWLEVINGHK